MDVVVGRVVKPHGVAGEVAVESRTDSPEQRFTSGAVLTGRARGGATRTLTVTGARSHGGRFLIRFSEVADRDGAEELRGHVLFADTDDLEPIEDPDEFYDHQVTGLRVQLPDGTPVGEVTDVVHAPGGELLEVRCAVPDGHERAPALVPFVRQIVIAVDVESGRVVVDPPEGLLDDE